MIQSMFLDGRNVKVSLPTGVRLIVDGDDFFACRGERRVRVAIHVDPRSDVVDSLLALDEPVRTP